MRRDRLRRDIREELEHHLALSIEWLRQRGFSEEEARREATRRLGQLDEVVQDLVPTALYRNRRMRFRDWMAAAAHDIRYAARSLARQPGLTITVVVTLALGIGANAAVFPIVDRLLFRMPGGVTGARGLRRVYFLNREAGERAVARGVFTYPDLLDMRTSARGIGLVAGYISSAVSIAGDTAASRRVGIAYVSQDYSSVLGLRMYLGRWFLPEELDVARPVLVAVISHAVWQSRFGADPGLIGREAQVGSRRFVVVGVTQPGFEGIDVEPTGVFAPIGLQRTISVSKGKWWETRGAMAMSLILRPQLADDDLISRNLSARLVTVAQAAGYSVPGRELLLGSILPTRSPEKPQQEPQIATRLAGVSLILLLIAVANITNLLLARSASREREIAIRRALGISGPRLVLLFVMEALWLALLAAAAAAICGGLLAGAMRGLLMPRLNWIPPVFDGRTIVFTALLAIGCALIAGLLPASHFGRSGYAASLRTGARLSAHGAAWMRSTLLAAQAALSVMLLVGAGLFATSLNRVREVDVGYPLDGLTAISFPARPEARPALEEARRAIAGLPGAKGVALAAVTPLRSVSQRAMFLPGTDSALADELIPDINAVSPEFFSTLQLPMVRGRSFTVDDAAGTAPVMIVNEEAARRIWPGGQPVGACLKLEKKNAPCYTIIGIARNAHRTRVVEDTPAQAYVLLSQAPAFSVGAVVIRGDNIDELTGLAVRRVASALGAGPPPMTMSYNAWLEPQLRPWRLGARLFSGVALLSLVLALVGLYSVLAYSVARRRQEIGVRLALGAQASDVAGLIVRQGLPPVMAGVALGLVIALVASRALAAILYETSTRDPRVYALMAGTVLFSGFVASLLPGFRAGRLDAMEALRSE